jgi:hypothetical protein
VAAAQAAALASSEAVQARVAPAPEQQAVAE